jgi:hypothetical protein
MRKIIIDSKQFDKLVKVLKEQDEEYYKISPQDYLDLLKYASYNTKVTGIKKFGGKPLYITGDLDVSRLPIDSLGNVIYIDGNLDISSTKISSLKGIEVKGRVNDWGTPIEAKRIRQEELKKLAEADERREDNDWDLTNPNIDEEGLAANALFDHLVSEGKLDEMGENIKEIFKSKIEQLEELRSSYNPTEEDSQDDIYDEMSDLEDDIEELQEKYADVYYIIPTSYRRNSNIYTFEVIGKRNQEYMVGTYDDMYDAAVESQEQLLDDIGLESLPQNLLMDNLDKESIREYIEEFYDNDIRESPESHFRQDDYELTDEQEERKEQLENQISDLKEQLENTQEEDEINDLEEQIDELQDEFDSIEPDDEPTEEMIEEKVSEYVKSAMKNPVNWIKSMDMEDSIGSYVNLRGVAEDIISSDGFGILSGYDGRDYDETVKTPDGKRYNFVIIRTQ